MKTMIAAWKNSLAISASAKQGTLIYFSIMIKPMIYMRDANHISIQDSSFAGFRIILKNRKSNDSLNRVCTKQRL